MTDTHRHEPGAPLGRICRDTDGGLEVRRCVHCSHVLIRPEDSRVWRTIADHVRRRHPAVGASLV